MRTKFAILLVIAGLMVVYAAGASSIGPTVGSTPNPNTTQAPAVGAVGQPPGPPNLRPPIQGMPPTGVEKGRLQMPAPGVEWVDVDGSVKPNAAVPAPMPTPAQVTSTAGAIKTPTPPPSPEFAPLPLDYVYLDPALYALNAYPFSPVYSGFREQHLYLASEIGRGGTIDQIALFKTYAWNYSGTFPNASVKMCNTSVSSLTSTFSDNYGGNTPVWVFHSNSWVRGGASYMWDTVALSTPFNYNGTDNLLVEITWTGSASGLDPYCWFSYVYGSVRRAGAYGYSSGFDTTTATAFSYMDNMFYNTRIGFALPSLDAASVSIDSPVGRVWGRWSYNPKATVRNHSASPQSFDVVFSIADGSGYASTKTTPVLNPNEMSQLTFDPWHPAAAGTFQTTCSTKLAGDMDNSNDRQIGTVKAWPAGWAALAPVPLGPGTRVKHGGWLAHKPLDQYVYASKGGATGEFYRYDIEGAPGLEWQSLASIPAYGGILPGDGSRGVHDGGNFIYATTGNDCPGFWRYDISDKNWHALADVPANLGGGTDLVLSPGVNVRPLQAVTGGYTGGPYGWGGYSMGYKFTPTQPGAVTQLGRFRGAYNDGSTIKLWDAANGNLLATANVTGTNWSYADITPVALTVGHEYWVTTYGGANVYYYIMPYEPYAVDGVKIIGGSYYWGDGMPTDYGYGVAYGMPDIHFERPSNVYLVQGNDGGFFRYDVTLNQWASLGKAPPQGGKWKSGSFLTSDGDHTIYAHRAECSPCELWAYDVTSGSWSQLSGMPGAKSQAGGCGDWYDGGIYAMKGANTNEFWRWDASAQWNALDPIPGVGVGMGADIVSHGRGAFFALKGGNTRELWVYVYVPEQLEGVQSSVTGRVEDAGMSLTLTPSPLVGNVLRIGYSLNQAGPASVTLFDVSGRAVAKRGFVAVRAGQLPLDLRRLSAGVYLVRLDDGHQSVVQKLVVQR